MRHPLVLVAEDERDIRELIVISLELEGFNVVEVPNGEEAVKKAKEIKPDLILMDLGVPEMDGWLAAQKLKSDEATKSIPLYALTAHTLPGERKRAIQAGFECHPRGRGLALE